MKVNGDIEGLRKGVIERLTALYDQNVPQGQLWTEALLDEISFLSTEINREIALYMDRKGRITDVSVGDHQTVKLSTVEGKRNGRRLSGTRCLHTHPNGYGLLSDVDMSSLKVLRLDAMIAIGVRHGLPQEVYVGILSTSNPEEVDIFGPYPPATEDFTMLQQTILETDDSLRHAVEEDQNRKERAILVGLQARDSRDLYGVSEAEVSFAELEELAQTAGALVVGRVMQKCENRNSKTVIGSGKISELALMVQALEADVVIFDQELSGSQQRNIEEAVGRKVLCRTALILDIFAQRARSREGILQVELAQMEYRLPRLMGMGLALSRLGGGIGTRGPGETKLETDRRHIRMRITNLKSQLAEIRRQRGVLRSNRQKTGIPVISIVGYTNAGKSTLLNALCETDVLAEDKLFATLDTTTRKLALDNGSTVLLTDTVGFIRKLPHNLLDAFKSTLEEVVLSDLILIVADASDPQVEDQIRIVDEILQELEAGTKPALIALNKIDKLAPDTPRILLHEDRQVVEISASNGDGLDLLKKAIENNLYSNRVQVHLAIPFSDGATLSWLHANGQILNSSYSEDATLVNVELDKPLLAKVSDYITD